MDARRDADFKIVMIKLINRKVSMREVEITQLVAESEKNPNTFCVPLLEVLDPGDGECLMMVMPFLRAFNDPPFETIGEAMFFILQAFKVKRFPFNRTILTKRSRLSNISTSILLLTGVSRLYQLLHTIPH